MGVAHRPRQTYWREVATREADEDDVSGTRPTLLVFVAADAFMTSEFTSKMTTSGNMENRCDTL